MINFKRCDSETGIITKIVRLGPQSSCIKCIIIAEGTSSTPPNGIGDELGP